MPTETVNLDDPKRFYVSCRKGGAFERGVYYICYGTRGSNGAGKIKSNIEEDLDLRKEYSEDSDA